MHPPTSFPSWLLYVWWGARNRLHIIKLALAAQVLQHASKFYTGINSKNHFAKWEGCIQLYPIQDSRSCAGKAGLARLQSRICAGEQIADKGVGTAVKQTIHGGLSAANGVKLLTRQKIAWGNANLIYSSVITECLLTSKNQGPDGKCEIIKSVEQFKQICEWWQSGAGSAESGYFFICCIAFGNGLLLVLYRRMKFPQDTSG